MGIGMSRADLRAVIFDYGEVLCYRPTVAEHGRLADYFGVAIERLPALWERNRGPFDRGDLAPELYWSMLAADAGVAIEAERMREICELDLAMWSNVNPVMVEWARQLRGSGLKVGIL